MAKRSVDVSKWRDPFYRALPMQYKLLWDFIYCDCDNAGVWIVDMDIASINVTKRVKEQEAVKLFGEKIYVFADGRKWAIRGFIDENVGVAPARLDPEKNKYHKSIVELLQKHDLSLEKLQGPQGRGLAGALQAPIYIEKVKTEVKAEAQGGVGGDRAPSQSADVMLSRNQVEALTQEELFRRSFDEITMESYAMAFKELDLVQQLADFKLKVTNAWSEYRHRDVAGMRNAFHHHLRSARDRKAPMAVAKRKAFKL